MKHAYHRLTVACTLLASVLAPCIARAYCPDPTAVSSCPFTASGDTTGGTSHVNSYLSCPQLTTYDGPDVSYKLTLSKTTLVTVAVTSSFDAAIVILPANAGDCNPDGCLAGADDVNGPGVEKISMKSLPAGDYYIVVDAFPGSAAGAFSLDVQCENCTDADSDGHFAPDAVNCPSGDDCCDSGTESSLGCSPSSAPSIFPGQPDYCADGIDQNCGGNDSVCTDSCPGAASLSCGAQVSGDTAGSSKSHDAYGGVPDALQGPEAYYVLTLDQAQDVTIKLSPQAGNASGAALLVLPLWKGFCDPLNAIGYADGVSLGSVTDSLHLEAGSWYVVVDSKTVEGAGKYNVSVGCGGCADADHDGLSGNAAGVCSTGTDCCDTGKEASMGCSLAQAPWIHPGAVNFCGDNIDSDCDGKDCCPDADGDGYGAASCGGGDCCDTGTEGSPGCSASSAQGIHPGAQEVCGNSVDENCDGVYETTCPNCHGQKVLTCPGASGSQVSTSDGTNVIGDYCAMGANLWTGPESVFQLTPDADTTLKFTVDYTAGESAGPIIDLFVLDDYGVPGTCNPSGCTTRSTSGGSGHEEVEFLAEKGHSYYFAIDERQKLATSFDYHLTCTSESCGSSDTVAPGDTRSGDNTGATNAINAYKGATFSYPAAENTYRFAPATDALARVELTFDAGIDLALVAIEADDQGACSPGHVVAMSDLEQSLGAEPVERVTFSARGGKTYYFVIDGWRTEEHGPYSLKMESPLQCKAGQALCGDQICVALDSDPLHCGGCFGVCATNEHCVSGKCTPAAEGGVAGGAGDSGAGPQDANSGPQATDPAGGNSSCACTTPGATRDGIRGTAVLGLICVGVIGMVRRRRRRVSPGRGESCCASAPR